MAANHWRRLRAGRLRSSTALSEALIGESRASTRELKGGVALDHNIRLTPIHLSFWRSVDGASECLDLGPMRILLIEDDLMIGKALRQALQDEGYAVDWVRDGEDAIHSASDPGYGLIALDLGLPGRDGMDVLRSIRAASNTTPVLIVTARDGVEDRIAGLDHGADDYVLKPFEIREFLARMRAVLRRRHGGQASSVVTCGDLSIDLATHRVEFRGQSHVLSTREFALIQALAERPGAVLARTQIEERVYGWGEEVESNAVDVLIHYVRRRFGKEVIRNIRGSGWTIGGGA